jgi:hypothetical protein
VILPEGSGALKKLLKLSRGTKNLENNFSVFENTETAAERKSLQDIKLG